MSHYKITINNETVKITSNSLQCIESEAIDMLKNKESGTVAIIELDRYCNEGVKPLSTVTKDEKAKHHTHDGYRFNV
jgi:hypothetical protein